MHIISTAGQLGWWEKIDAEHGKNNRERKCMMSVSGNGNIVWC